MFPGRLFKFRSRTTIEPVRLRTSKGQQGAHQQQQHENLAVGEDGSIEPINHELTYNYTPTGVASHIPKLKIEVPFMVVGNVLAPDLVNGAMFVLKNFKRLFLHVPTMPRDGNPLKAHPLHQIGFQFDFKDFKVKRRHFPVHIAFRVTVHTSHGQMLSGLLVDLHSPFFSSGKLYTALSRTKKSEDVLLLHKDTNTSCGGHTPDASTGTQSYPTSSSRLCYRYNFLEKHH